MYKALSIFRERPEIGTATGLGSSLLYSLKVMFTSDIVLKGLSIFGIWAGAIITLITLVLKCMELFERCRKWFKKRRSTASVE